MKNPELETIGNFKFLEYYFHLIIEREYYDIAGLCDIEIVKKINMNFIQNEESIIPSGFTWDAKQGVYIDKNGNFIKIKTSMYFGRGLRNSEICYDQCRI